MFKVNSSKVCLGGSRVPHLTGFHHGVQERKQLPNARGHDDFEGFALGFEPGGTFPIEDKRLSYGALLIRLVGVCPPRCWDLVYGETVESSAAGCLESSAPVDAMSPLAWDQRSQPRWSKVKS